MGKKKFIDKKSAVTFRLVNRSQHDPLYVDEKAPQHVLVPVRLPPKYANLVANHNRPVQEGPIDTAKRKKEQAKFGIFFDDDYDYLQHLREPGRNEVTWEPVPSKSKSSTKETAKPDGTQDDVHIQLPSSVFASEFEEKEGIMKKAAEVTRGPRPDWDPDVVAALDEDFDFDNPDNALEDNFMELAMQPGGDNDGEFFDEEDEDGLEFDSDEMDDEDYSDEERDGLGPLDDFGKEETKSRFTEYSMSSSVIRRNEQLTLLDDRFEKFFEQYDDPEVGALDCEEIEGHVDTMDEVVLQCAAEYKRKHDQTADIEFDKQWIKERLTELQEEPEDGEETVEMEVEEGEQKKWDCESILSTYSNIYNHPKLIQEPKRVRKIQINPKTGLPENVLGPEGGKLTMKSVAQLEQHGTDKPSGPKSLCDGSVISTLSVLSLRPKDETPEEKRERKKLLKEYRAERRIERKANTLAFKHEKQLQEKSKINSQRNAGQKIV
uniref:Protein LTV1 homolog n=1 Tax=Anopheles farauti TaxID=69004 RepID=A0A182R1E6_9DIPT